MTETQFDDLKQLINARASQTEQSLAGKMAEGFAEVRHEMAEGFAEVRQEMAEGFSGVGDAVSMLIDKSDNHEHMITKLKSQVA
ncbi:MAG: hypothetical protein ABIV43_00475 [Candidatus Saccharimonadales bacterium]